MYDRCYAFIWLPLPWNLIWHWNFSRSFSWTIRYQANSISPNRDSMNTILARVIYWYLEGRNGKVSKAGTCREACRILAEQQEGAEPGQLLHDFTRPQELTLCRHLGCYSFLNSCHFFFYNIYKIDIVNVNDTARIPLGYFFPVLWIRIRIRIGYGFNGVPGSRFTIQIQVQEGKNDPQNRGKKLINFIFWSTGTGCSLLRAEGFSCSVDVLYVGLGMSKIAIFIKNNFFLI